MRVFRIGMGRGTDSGKVRGRSFLRMILANRELLSAVLALILCTGVPAHAAQDGGDAVPKIHVTGEATLELPADQLQLSISVVTEDDEAKVAMGENSRRVKRVIEALTTLGLEEKEYQTGRFTIQPRYSQRPKNVPEDWTPRIVGYRVENMLHVKTKKLELIGDLINNAVDAGANSIPSIGFDLSDPRLSRAEAIQQATRNAIADAAALADAAGVELGEVLSMRLDDLPVGMPKAVRAPRLMMEMAESAAPPIQPGDVTVRARVEIVYRIGEGSL